MRSHFRSNLRPTVAVAVAAVAAIAAAATPACRGSARDEQRPLVARISGVPIYADEFKREYRRLRLDDGAGLPVTEGEGVQKRALLDDMINRHLVLQEAERANVLVASGEVEAAFARAKSGWEDGVFGTELSDKDLTQAELKAELRGLLLGRKYFRDHVFSRVAVTDQEIEAHIAAHPELFAVPEQVRARYVVLKTDEEAQRVLQEIKAGLTFEDAAIKYSQSPDGKTGGDLGWFARGVMPHEFDEICFSLPPGQVSKVVPGEYGFYLFKVLEKQPGQQRSPVALREQVEALLRREKERAAQEAKIAELRQAAVIEIQEEQLAHVH